MDLFGKSKHDHEDLTRLGPSELIDLYCNTGGEDVRYLTNIPNATFSSRSNAREAATSIYRSLKSAEKHIASTYSAITVMQVLCKFDADISMFTQYFDKKFLTALGAILDGGPDLLPLREYLKEIIGYFQDCVTGKVPQSHQRLGCEGSGASEYLDKKLAARLRVDPGIEAVASLHTHPGLRNGF